MLTHRTKPERETSDEVVEFVIEVLGVANEFLADKLKLICSAVLRRYSESLTAPVVSDGNVLTLGPNSHSEQRRVNFGRCCSFRSS